MFSKGLVLAPFEPKRVLKAELCCYPVSSVCMFRTWHRVVADVPWGLILGDKIPIKECLQLGVLMSIAVNAHELRKRLFLGDEKRAEVVSSKAFLSFYRESTRLPVADGIPSRLVGLAYSAMQPCRAERSVRTNDPSLENCILLLDCRQRAVFIMRNVLRMSWPTVAGASGSSVEDAKESWPTANARY